MKWAEVLRGDPVPWLLEPDDDNPSVRYFTLREIQDRPTDDPEVRLAASRIMETGPVPIILAAQHPEGWWVEPGSGYGSGYRSTAWQVFLFAELGADPGHRQVRAACEYLIDHATASNGGFAVSDPPVPSKVVHCHNGDTLHALIRLGFDRDARFQAALTWQVRSITGVGENQYYKSGTSAPDFECAVNGKQSCAWGATKAMKALAAIPPADRTPDIENAINRGIHLLFSRDPATADYPFTGRISSSWFKFGFPLSYWSDVLETTSVLASLGYGADPRLANVTRLVLDKQDEQGRWTMEHAIIGKMWVDIERKGQPSKWVTLRALRFLKHVYPG